MSRYARRKDATHKPVVAAFESAGCTWLNIESTSEAGVPDGLLGCTGRSHLVEIKPNRTTTHKTAQLAPRASQVAWALKWRGGPVHVVRSAAEAFDLVNLIRVGRK